MLQHPPFGMELHAEGEGARAGQRYGFDQAIFGQCLDAQARRQPVDALAVDRVDLAAARQMREIMRLTVGGNYKKVDRARAEA